MEKQPYEIECSRCGETGLELLAEAEARGIRDGIAPVFKQCQRCGEMTGWVEARGGWASTGEVNNRPMPQPSAGGRAAGQLVPHGQERMATQSERDEVNEVLRRSEAVQLGDSDQRGRSSPNEQPRAMMNNHDSHTASELLPASSDIIEARQGEPALALRDEALSIARTPRPASDQVNRFLLCTLVFEAARKIKASAAKGGLNLPMTRIVRRVLQAYRLAAAEKRGALAEPVLNCSGYIHEKTLIGEIARELQGQLVASETCHTDARPRDNRNMVMPDNQRIEPVIAGSGQPSGPT